jgi:hypothetical protein
MRPMKNFFVLCGGDECFGFLIDLTVDIFFDLFVYWSYNFPRIFDQICSWIDVDIDPLMLLDLRWVHLFEKVCDFRSSPQLLFGRGEFFLVGFSIFLEKHL